jgi:hypothetical protein
MLHQFVTSLNCFRKGGFSKTKDKTPASKESDPTSEIFDQAPNGMSKEEFENWLAIDNNAEVVATMTVFWEYVELLPMINPN